MSRPTRTQFIGIDGEGITRTDDSGIQDYVMLCASTGEYIENPEGLSSVDCFEFVLNLKRKNPTHTIVGFGFNYDVNMMLKDVPRYILQDLWKHRKTNVVFPGGDMYGIEWIPGKIFKIRGEVIATVSDVFGFFQSKFVSALKDWKIPDLSGVLERIESGKESRSDFTYDDMPEMRRYCLDECAMLVELMEALQDALLDADLRLRHWIGAGSVASEMMRKWGVLDHHVPDDSLPPDISRAVMFAYYGGRFQMLQQGSFPECYNYDLISAYPNEARNLPTLYGEWEERKSYDPEASYALWLCEWDLPTNRPVMPFPYRLKSNEIWYPSSGLGWYWGEEVKAALLMHPEIKVRRGYVFTPQYTKKPFWFVDMVAQKRKAAKAQGKASQKVYKLGMNSLYGKLAQGAGFQGRTPRFRSFVWAGMITSNTRAKLLQYSLGNESSVIAYATDGLFFDKDVGLPTGDELGQLELNYVKDFYVLSNGIYFTGSDVEAAKKLRTRGHNPKELDINVLKEAWYQEGPEFIYRYQSKRFIGLGVALLLKDFSKWRKWITAERILSFDQSGRMWLSDRQGEFAFPGVDLHYENQDYGDAVRWFSPPAQIELPKRYVPKTDIHSIQSDEEREAVLQLILELDQPRVLS